MEASILVVSKNRLAELRKTLLILEKCISKEQHEILVFLDGCTDGSEKLQDELPWVQWYASKVSIGASMARNLLYEEAKGEILFGFDDDAHPVQEDFIEKAFDLFKERPGLGIIAFKEVKGRYKDLPLPDLQTLEEDYLTKDFMGCGFAIRSDVYSETRGFPKWIDIYGEEVCVALEVLDKNYEILFTHQIVVNHRIDPEARRSEGGNFFRFGRQLKNMANFYVIYYPFPLLLKKVARLYYMNFLKYGLRNRRYFKEFGNALFRNLADLKSVLKYRQPVSRKTLNKFDSLPNPKY